MTQQTKRGNWHRDVEGEQCARRGRNTFHRTVRRCLFLATTSELFVQDLGREMHDQVRCPV